MSPFAQRFTINEPDVVAEDFDGQLVILNLANGHYFSLQGCGGDIWAALASGHAPDAILDAIRAFLPEIADASRELLGRLIELQLIRPDGAPVELPAGSASGWRAEPPRLEVYEDLAELIYADPIHDVDEQAGWPKQRQDP